MQHKLPKNCKKKRDKMLWWENKDTGKQQRNQLSQSRIINKIQLEGEQWKIRMDKMSVWILKTNNLLLNTAYGEDFRSVLMRNFGRESQKVIILKHNQLHSGPMLKIERITICQQQLDQIRLLEPLDSLKLPIK